MTCSCCQATAFHGLNGLGCPSCECTCPPNCGCGCRGSKSRNSKCKCNGNCRCGSQKVSINVNCPCGCGGKCGCGPSASSHHHGSAMGSFDEYPRPKSALFDPRQLNRVWPEPYPDPLIPYVKANEGLLPYDSLNRYKGQPNSLHGYLAMGIADNTTPDQAAYKATKEMMDFVSVENLGLSYLYENPVPSGSYKPSKVRPSKNFFAFVPVIRRQGNVSVGEFYIRCGGPETKLIYWDEGVFAVDAEERRYIQGNLSNTGIRGVPDSWSTLLQQQLNMHYPLVLESRGKDFKSTFLVGTKYNDYSNTPAGYTHFGVHILDHLFSTAIDMLQSADTSETNKVLLREVLTKLISVCLNASATVVSEISLGIAKAMTERLIADLKTVAEMGNMYIEIEDWGANTKIKIDDRMSDVLKMFNTDISPQKIATLTTNIANGIEDAIQLRRRYLANIYKQFAGASAEATELLAKLEAENKALQSQIDTYKESAKGTKEDQTKETPPASEKSTENSSSIGTNIAIAAAVSLAAYFVFQKIK